MTSVVIRHLVATLPWVMWYPVVKRRMMTLLLFVIWLPHIANGDVATATSIRAEKG